MLPTLVPATDRVPPELTGSVARWRDAVALASGMRVRDLGPLLVAVGTEERLVTGTRGAAMLALLTMNVNQRVSVDALMEAAWGEQVSAGAASTLASHVWRLRQLLEPERDRGQRPSVLVNDSDGYRLVGGPSTVDSLHFAETVSEVRDLLAAGDAEAAIRRADSALAMWRGQPYAGLADAEWAQAPVARLEELHGQLQERRIEGLLVIGAVDEALSGLQPLIAASPFRESLRVLWMSALYRSGRGTDAVQAYRDARRILLDEVGIEPGVELQEMHQRILSGDPTLDLRSSRSRAALPRNGEVHLPSWLTPLLGREVVLGRLVDLIHHHRLVTITGAAGCGKTRVAVEAARAAAPAFPDGTWFVDLTAVSDPKLVVDVLISTIGFAASAGATPLEDLRRYLQTRRILLVLDNCEHVLPAVDEIAQVTLGDPGATPQCAFLTTSREPIDVDGETIWTLEPLALPRTQDVNPASAPAVELFLQRLAAVAPALELDDAGLARVVEISVAVDGLPLPIELAAARALSHSLNDIAAQVRDDPSRLSRVGRGPSDHRATVRSAIEWSHRLLSSAEQRAHRRLSVLPGPFTASLAAAVIGEVGPAGVDDLLAQLVHRSLLTSEGSSGPGRPTVFRQLATVRSHGRHVLDGESHEAWACLDRRDRWTSALLAARPPLGTPAEADWYRAIDDDYATVRATLARLLLDDQDPLGGRLASRLFYYWYYREMMVEASRWLDLGHRALLDGDPVDLFLAKIGLAASLTLQGRSDLAVSYVAHVLAPLPSTEPARLAEVGEALIGLTMAAMFRGEDELVIGLDHQLTQIVEVVRSPNLELLARAVACRSLFARGLVDESIRAATSVQHAAAVADNLMASWMVTGPPVVTALRAAEPGDGVPWLVRGLVDHLHFGTGAVGLFVETLANFMALADDYSSAAELYAAGRSETLRAAMPWPRRAVTDQLLASTRDHLTPDEYQRAWQHGEQLTMSEVVGRFRATGGLDAHVGRSEP